MCALTALCSVCCVVSTKHTQRLQAAGLRLHNRNVILRSKWKSSYDSDHKYRSGWERLSCRKLPMDQYCKLWHHFPKVCNFTNH